MCNGSTSREAIFGDTRGVKTPGYFWGRGHNATRNSPQKGLVPPTAANSLSAIVTLYSRDFLVNSLLFQQGRQRDFPRANSNTSLVDKNSTDECFSQVKEEVGAEYVDFHGHVTRRWGGVLGQNKLVTMPTLIQSGWDGTWDSASLAGSLELLMLPAHGSSVRAETQSYSYLYYVSHGLRLEEWVNIKTLQSTFFFFFF